LGKVLYGLKQVPRAWYGRLRGFLFERGFEMGKVDQTLFLLRHGRDILIVEVYMDGIVFGGLSNSLVARFGEDMSKEFDMTMMGELQFFLGLQIKQSKEGTFMHQAKYTKDIVRKFKMEDSKAMATPMSTTTTLDADEEGEHVDQKEYRSMILSLLYLTATRPDIQYLTTATAPEAVRGIHGHSDRGVVPDPTDAATYRPTAETEATSWAESCHHLRPVHRDEAPDLH
jgi:hypothetical protein